LFAGAVLIGVVGALGVYGVPAPPGFTVEGMPRIPWVHVWRSTRVVRSFGALRTFAGWYGHERRMLVTYGSDRQLRRVGVRISGDVPEPMTILRRQRFRARGNPCN
jgi:hypothetical protein